MMMGERGKMKRRVCPCPGPSGERGAALIAVLCVLMMIGLFTMSALVISQISNQVSKTVSDRGLAAYWAEGAASRAVWLLLNDKRKNPNRGLGGDTEIGGTDDDDGERFMADGTEHKTKIYENDVSFKIYDMASGTNISGSDAVGNLSRDQQEIEDEGKDFQDYQAFIDRVSDYIDADDFVRTDGMEKNEFSGEGLAPLPRNAPMKFREEMLLIPGIEDFLEFSDDGRLTAFQVIPLEGMPQVTGKQNFFSSSNAQLKKDGFSDDDISQINEAKQAYGKDKTPISDSLDANLVSRIKGKYSFNESGFYTFVVTGKGTAGAARTMVFSVQIVSRLSGDRIRYYDWALF